MSHFARMDGNTVVQVIVVNNADAPDEATGIAFCKSLYGADTEWVRCSYNATFRKQYPGAGFTYDPIADVFVSPRPFASWTLDSNHDWQPPVSYPTDGGDYRWNEQAQTWTRAEVP